MKITVVLSQMEVFFSKYAYASTKIIGSLMPFSFESLVKKYKRNTLKLSILKTMSV